MVTMQDAADQYMQHLRATGHSRYTLYTVEGCLKSFIASAGNISIEYATQQAIPFLAKRAEAVKANSLCVEFSHIKTFMSFCVQRGWIEHSPLEGMKGPRREIVVTMPLTDAEIGALCEDHDEWGRAMVILLLGSGMRIGELAALRWTDIKGEKLIVHGKGSKQRTLMPGRKALETLYNLPHDGDRVFPFSHGAIIQRICRMSRRSSVPFHGHQLRHTFANRFLTASGGDIEALSSILGHSNLNTTAVYLRAFRRERALAAQRRYNPADAFFGINNDDGGGGASNIIAFRPRVAAGAR